MPSYRLAHGDPLLEPSGEFELEAYRCGYRWVAGIDEAGRGPLAGPVVAAAVILPRCCRLPGLNDSKQLPEAERARLYEVIWGRAVGVGVGVASAQEIDGSNILEATRLAMGRAVKALSPQPQCLLVDALTLPLIPLPQRPIVKGDKLSVSVAAASIVAKVTRDRLMADYHKMYPVYNFTAHKGYPTSEHLRLLGRHGPCILHRRTFRPVLESAARKPSMASDRGVRQGELRKQS